MLITPLTHVVMLRDKFVPKILSRILIGNVCYIFTSKVKISLIFFFKPGMLYKFHVKTTLSEEVIGYHSNVIRNEIISKIILSRNLLIEKFKDDMICNPFKIDRQRSYLYFRENCLETFIGISL